MNQFQEIFDKQKAYFDSDATKSYEWRIDQLTRLENLCNENAEALEAAMSTDFKPASQEKVLEIMAPVGTAAFAKQELKEWMKPVDVVVPKALRESGHSAKVYREPYGVTLVIGPFNGPLTLLFDPAVDRKTTRLNSSHSQISYAVFCLKKKKKKSTHLSRYLYTIDMSC